MTSSPNHFSSESDTDRTPACDEAIMTQARAWVRKLSAGKPTTADAQALKQWCAQSPVHGRALTLARQEWRSMETVLRQAHARLPPVQVPSRKQRAQRRAFLGAGIVAFGSLAVAGIVRPPLGLWPSLEEMGADYRTAIGEQREVQMHDHARLMLNTKTSVTVTSEPSVTRVRLIAGEAALFVEDGARLRHELQAGNGRVAIENAGCVTAQRLADGRVRLTCTEGNAVLQHPARAVTLTAGQQIYYTDIQVQSHPASVDPLVAQAWQEGIVVFNGQRLDEAVTEINRYRPGRVVLLSKQAAQQRISGRFQIDALDQAIVLIEQLYQLPVRRMGDVVLIG